MLALAHRAARPGHGDLGLDHDRRPRRRSVRVPGAPAAAGADRRGGGGADLLDSHRSRLEQLALPLLLLAVALLLLVLVPGLGHVVNGSRRWLRLAGMNFQVSEAARVLTLIYIASYAVRYEEALRSGLPGLARPLALLAVIALLLLLEPDFGAASVLFVTGFGVLFLAGARLALDAGDAAGRRRLR